MTDYIIDEFITQLRLNNDMLEDGIKSATHLIKRYERDVEALKALLKPTSKVGYKDVLERFLEASTWELGKKKRELQRFKDDIESNNVIIEKLIK